jgi:adenylate kinase
MQLIFLGYPGSGKGTQASLLSDKYKIPRISTGDILREAVARATELGVRAKKFMDSGELVPDEVIIDLVVERLGAADTANGYILDGFPRTLHQAQELDYLLMQHFHREMTAVISLEIEKKKVIGRLTSRRVCSGCGRVYNLQTDPPPTGSRCETCNGAVIQRSDDTLETVLHRMDVYEEATRPLKSYYGAQGKLIQIDGSLNIEKVHQEIESKLALLAARS